MEAQSGQCISIAQYTHTGSFATHVSRVSGPEGKDKQKRGRLCFGYMGFVTRDSKGDGGKEEDQDALRTTTLLYLHIGRGDNFKGLHAQNPKKRHEKDNEKRR